MAERFPGRPEPRDTYHTPPKTLIVRNTFGPESAQEAINEGDPYKNGGVTKYPKKTPSPPDTA